MLNLVPKVDAASMIVEETRNSENIENVEQDVQKKKKNKKQKIGFRDRKVYWRLALFVVICVHIKILPNYLKSIAKLRLIT